MLVFRKWFFCGVVCCLCIETQAAASQWELNGLQLEIISKDAQQQKQVAQVIVPLLQQLNAVASEIKHLNRVGELKNPSTQVTELLDLCDRWQDKTQQKFTCRLGALHKDWQAAEAAGELPDRAALRKKARLHLSMQWHQQRGALTFSDAAKAAGLQLDLQGLWQGWVMTQLIPLLERSDVSVRYGNLRWRNKSASQTEPIALNNIEPFSIVVPDTQTLAVLDRTSNLYSVGHYQLSNILVPEEGWPVEYPPSLLVRANTAIEAGVLAQATLVTPGHQAADVKQNAGVAVLTITETGKFLASQDWHLDDKQTTHADQNVGAAPITLIVDFEVPELSVADYRRPYIAIWISDASGQPVQSLLVAGDSRRWLRELRLWWRRLGRTDETLIDAMAGATRKPGRYQVSWNGRNFNGQQVAAGNYALRVEIAREHGERELLVLPFVLGDQPIKRSQRGKAELGLVTIRQI
jgi:thiamine biosynthesis lipoprotein